MPISIGRGSRTEWNGLRRMQESTASGHSTAHRSAMCEPPFQPKTEKRSAPSPFITSRTVRRELSKRLGRSVEGFGRRHRQVELDDAKEALERLPGGVPEPGTPGGHPEQDDRRLPGFVTHADGV